MKPPFLSRELAFTAIGVLVAPLVFALLLVLRGVLVDELGEHSFGEAFVVTGIFYLYAFVTTFFIAIPAFVVFRYFGLIRWWSASLVGAIVGLIVGFLFGGLQLEGLVVFGIAACLSALAFWFIWRQGYPALKK